MVRPFSLFHTSLPLVTKSRENTDGPPCMAKMGPVFQDPEMCLKDLTFPAVVSVGLEEDAWAVARRCLHPGCVIGSQGSERAGLLDGFHTGKSLCPPSSLPEDGGREQHWGAGCPMWAEPCHPPALRSPRQRAPPQLWAWAVLGPRHWLPPTLFPISASHPGPEESWHSALPPTGPTAGGIGERGHGPSPAACGLWSRELCGEPPGVRRPHGLDGQYGWSRGLVGL